MLDGMTMAAEDGEGEGEPAFLEGPVSMLDATRQASVDNADGTATVGFAVLAKEIPKDLLASPDGSQWRLAVAAGAEAEASMVAVRLAIRDLAGGKALLRFMLMPTGLAASAIWGRKGERATLRMAMLAGRHPYPHFVGRSERAAALRRAAMFCGEPGFAAWIADQAVAAGLPPAGEIEVDPAIGIGAADATSMRAAENLCRVARLHSRSEILTSNVAAERAESLMRQYREFAWQRGGAARAAEARRRGL